MRIFLIAIAALLLAASPAQAQDALERAGETLKLDPVYVGPDAERGISDAEADDLRAQISDDEAGPLYIAVLPESAASLTSFPVDENAVLGIASRLDAWLALPEEERKRSA